MSTEGLKQPEATFSGLRFTPLSLPSMCKMAAVASTRKRGRLHVEEPEASMWNTPALRPMNEPPMLNGEEFQRTHVASDIRYLAIFSNEPEKRARMKDVDGEHEAE